MAAYLLENGAVLDRVDERGRSGLHAAVLGRDEKMCRWLLEKGLSPTEPVSKAGESPIELAAREASLPIIKLLLEFGAEKSPALFEKAEKAERSNKILYFLRVE